MPKADDIDALLEVVFAAGCWHCHEGRPLHWRGRHYVHKFQADGKTIRRRCDMDAPRRAANRARRRAGSR